VGKFPEFMVLFVSYLIYIYILYILTDTLKDTQKREAPRVGFKVGGRGRVEVKMLIRLGLGAISTEANGQQAVNILEATWKNSCRDRRLKVCQD